MCDCDHYSDHSLCEAACGYVAQCGSVAAWQCGSVAGADSREKRTGELFSVVAQRGTLTSWHSVAQRGTAWQCAGGYCTRVIRENVPYLETTQSYTAAKPPSLRGHLLQGKISKPFRITPGTSWWDLQDVQHVVVQ